MSAEAENSFVNHKFCITRNPKYIHPDSQILCGVFQFPVCTELQLVFEKSSEFSFTTSAISICSLSSLRYSSGNPSPPPFQTPSQPIPATMSLTVPHLTAASMPFVVRQYILTLDQSRVNQSLIEELRPSGCANLHLPDTYEPDRSSRNRSEHHLPQGHSRGEGTEEELELELGRSEGVRMRR